MSFNDKLPVQFGEKYLDSDHNIGPGKSGMPKGAPSGYKILPDNQITQQIIDISRSILRDPWGTILPFIMDGKNYIARKEPHFHPYGSNWKNQGWHVGASVYIKTEDLKNLSKQIEPSKENPPPEQIQQKQSPDTSSTSKLTFLQRLDKILSLINK